MSTEPKHGVSGRSHLEKAIASGIALFLCLIFALFAGTQYVAWSHGYEAALGQPFYMVAPETRNLLPFIGAGLLVVAFVGYSIRVTRRLAGLPMVGAASCAVLWTGILYAPYKVFPWVDTLLRYPDTQAAAYTTIGVMVAGAGITAAGLFPLMGYLDARGHSGAYGTAKWGEGKSLKGHEEGWFLGKHRGKTLRYAEDAHMLTMAPTRTGKGVGAVLPNMLDHRGSAAAIDPKGEIYATTWQYRENVLGQKIRALDPFGIVVGGEKGNDEHLATYNPLDIINVGDEKAVALAQMLADMIVEEDGGQNDSSMWVNEARQYVKALILYVCATESKESGLRSLPYVRHLISLGNTPGKKEEYDLICRAHEDYFADYTIREEHLRRSEGTGISDMDGRPMTLQGLWRDMMAFPGAFARQIYEGAIQVSAKAPRERSGVLSHVKAETNFLGLPSMQRSLRRSNFDIRSLKGTGSSFYFILPQEYLDTGVIKWMRLMVGTGLKVFVSEPGQPEKRTLFILDEFAHIGRLEPIETAFGLMAGSGLTCWAILQNIGQLKKLYKKSWQTFIANAGVIQAFENSDPESAKLITEMIGKTTVWVENENRSNRYSWSDNSNSRSIGLKETSRNLINPDELSRIGEGSQILLVRGDDPVKAKKIKHFEEDPFASRISEGYNHMEGTYTFSEEQEREALAARANIAPEEENSMSEFDAARDGLYDFSDEPIPWSAEDGEGDPVDAQLDEEGKLQVQGSPQTHPAESGTPSGDGAQEEAELPETQIPEGPISLSELASLDPLIYDGPLSDLAESNAPLSEDELSILPEKERQKYEASVAGSPTIEEIEHWETHALAGEADEA